MNENSQRGNILIIGAVLLAFVMVAIAFIYIGSRQSSENGLAVKPVDLTATPPPRAKVPETPSPFEPTTEISPNLPALHELSLASTMTQQQFSDEDFPFHFYFPGYFVTEKIDMEQKKVEFTEMYPTREWRMIAQQKVGVPNDDTQFNYSSCTNFMTIIFTKFSKNNQSLSDFIKLEHETYPGGYDVYKTFLSQVNYPRPNSYLFAGNMSETKVKEVFFEVGDAFYSAYLSGGCNTSEGYSANADKLYTDLLQSLTF